MSTSLAIYTLLAQMPLGHIFTTRELIGIGSRAAIDKCLHRLVKKEAILRLARGVFCNGNVVPNIMPMELAQIKARAFDKEVYEHASTTAQRLGYTPKPPSQSKEPLTFATSGTGSTSFQSIFGTIQLKAASARKRHQHKNEVWELVKALWNIGMGGINKRIQNRIALVWGRKSQESLQTFCASIPQWVLEQLPTAKQHAIKTILSACLKRVNDEENARSAPCSCPDASNCVCPMMSCKHCQMMPIRNRFSILLG